MGRLPLALGAALSVGLHGAALILLAALPAARDHEDPLTIPLEVTAAEDAQGRGHTPAESAPVVPGGLPATDNALHPRRGRGGDARGPSHVVLLVEHTDAVTLDDSPMNTTGPSQVQRIRTAARRASWEDRRATPHPSDDAFLASSIGAGHPERRTPTWVDARPGALRTTEKSQAGHARYADPAPRRSHRDGIGERRGSEASRPERPGAAVEAPSLGIAGGRGRESRRAARVRRGRPPVDRGPAATLTRHKDRVADDRDSELLAARMVQSFVTASERRGTHEGQGRGGRGSKDPAASGGREGAGAKGTALRPGSGTFPALDTRDARYVRWYLDQKRRVERVLIFPRARQLSMDQGTSVFELTVGRNGRLLERPELRRSSGFVDLDEAARRAIEEATPFSPLPATLAPEHEAIRITLAVNFDNPMVQ